MSLFYLFFVNIVAESYFFLKSSSSYVLRQDTHEYLFQFINIFA